MTTGTSVLLLSLAPGAHADFRDPPLDRNAEVIEGEAFAGDRLLRAGDYQLAPDGAAAAALQQRRGQPVFRAFVEPAGRLRVFRALRAG